MSDTLVIVESPSKAKTINKYLGSEYKVLASYGHVRDLLSKNGSVQPDNNFNMIWFTEERSKKHVKEIINAALKAKKILLATDPDREGEAISWHIHDILRDEKGLRDKEIKRIVFNEITKKAILEAIKQPRDINRELVDAYLARRALDYLVGFTLSPILWRKLPGAKSAGRVQSVALRLVVEREIEIEKFITTEYWSIVTSCANPKNQNYQARLNILAGEKLDKFGLPNEVTAMSAVEAIKAGSFIVKNIEKKQSRRHPAAPFTTSTLQQEASRKLGMSPKKTMTLAQKLYEGIDIGGETVGLITYMRTDSVALSNDAVIATRSLIKNSFGDAYLPNTPRLYKNKSKNAQEAHEAIRPTELTRLSSHLLSCLDNDQLRLYELIWNRTVASQMESAVFDTMGVDITSTSSTQQTPISLRATGSTLVFDGFLKLYQEGSDDKPTKDEDNNEALLPPLTEGELVKINEVIPNQHFTQPPPRYSEASLVKKLEELGIGRPSTYVSLLQTLQDRSYVRLEKKQFRPEERGRLVTSFLKHYFHKYVEYGFTANLEGLLDDISAGEIAWLKVMEDFWLPFDQTVKKAEPLTITQVLDDMERDLESILFDMSKPNPKQCSTCKTGKLSLKLSKFGPFLGCNNYPDCSFTKSIGTPLNSDGEALTALGDVTLIGTDPETQIEINLRKGPYGFYLQWEVKDVKKPKRVGLPAGMLPSDVNLEQALILGRLPINIGKHPTTGDDLTVNLGRFGPYIKFQSIFVTIPKTHNFLEVTVEDTLPWIEKKLATIARNAALGIVGRGFKKTKVSPSKPTTTKKAEVGKATIKKIQAKTVDQTLPEEPVVKAKRSVAKKS